MKQVYFKAIQKERKTTYSAQSVASEKVGPAI
jgi:hypothetical protein